MENSSPEKDLVDEFAPYRLPLLMGCLGVVLFGVMNFPDTVKLWPHPVFWKTM